MIDITQIRPLPGMVLVQQDDGQDKTQSGIFLPDSAKKDKPQIGVVIAVGDSESPCRSKDRVIFKKWGGNELEVGDITYQFLPYEDVLGVISERK
jgi:chaperonin GroES